LSIDDFINAAKMNNKSVITEYLHNGFNINEKDEYGFTVLQEAAEFGHKDLFWYLINKGADIRNVTYEGYNVIHAIAIGGDNEMLKYAIDKGISIKDRITSGEQKGMDAEDYARMFKNNSILSDIIKYKGIA